MYLFAANSAYRDIVAGLRGLGYHGSLIEEDYGFIDWFSGARPERRMAAVAFGQTPVSYDSALIGVTKSSGISGRDLIDGCRALGAPIVLEVGQDEVREWAVSRKAGEHSLLGRHAADRIADLFVSRAADWKPEALFRAKNIGSFHWAPQLNLFSGLLPELEDHVQESLDPLLRSALWATKSAYVDSAGRDPDETQLFQLIFWLLTAKVFHDRGVSGFAHLQLPNPDDILAAVARQYRIDEVPRLLNRDARWAAAEGIWRSLDFRNLSVEVLSQIWARTLVDAKTKRRLGIHRTSRTIVRYMVDRIPFAYSGDDKRIVFEPCCGSGVFLIGAMNALRHNLFGMPPAERHNYFIKHLAGIEKEPFGVEISRLALTLADFPNPGGWDIQPADVFDGTLLSQYLQRAGVVLCNPPFEQFEREERNHYQLASVHKPAELLHRVLDHLHPSGVIGFVLPRAIATGRGYAGVRKRLVERFSRIEITLLPDRAFEADPEIVLLIATDPIPHYTCRVSNRRVSDNAEAWQRFELTHEVSSEAVSEVAPEQAADGLLFPELPNVWAHLVNFPVLADVAELHRGIEWNEPLTKDGEETGNRKKFIRETNAPGFWRGVAPKTKFDVFELPHMPYLSLRLEHKRTNAYRLPWAKPKAILNKSTRSRGKWRMSAFPDSDGVTCYQTYIAAWPKSDGIDEWVLAAVLNSPVANAFVSTRAGKIDITMEMLKQVPVPLLTKGQVADLRRLIQAYQRLTQHTAWTQPAPPHNAEAEHALKQIDAVVLEGYHLPARVEHELLEFFRGEDRPTPFSFGPYLPQGEDVFFSLSKRLSPEFKESTGAALLKRMAIG